MPTRIPTRTLLETVAGCVLERVAVTFTPVDPDGTGMPVGVRVGVTRQETGGRVAGGSVEVPFGAMLRHPDGREAALVEAVDDACGGLLPVRGG